MSYNPIYWLFFLFDNAENKDSKIESLVKAFDLYENTQLDFGVLESHIEFTKRLDKLMDGKPERDFKGFYNLIAQQYQNMPKERVWNFVN